MTETDQLRRGRLQEAGLLEHFFYLAKSAQKELGCDRRASEDFAWEQCRKEVELHEASIEESLEQSSGSSETRTGSNNRPSSPRNSNSNDSRGPLPRRVEDEPTRFPAPTPELWDGKPTVSERNQIRWVQEHLAFDVDEIDPSDCPSKGTWGLFIHTKSSKQSTAKFYETIWPKILPREAEDANETGLRKGEHVIGLLSSQLEKVKSAYKKARTQGKRLKDGKYLRK